MSGALQYKFEYDKFGRTTANKVGNGSSWKTLSEMDYNTAGLLAKQTYGNGDYVDFTYDSFDRQTEKKYNGDNSQRVTYSYGNNGSVAQITDYFTNSNTRFTYDLAERVVSQREYSGTAKNGGNLLSYTDFAYADKTNYLTGIKHFSPLGTQTIGYTYGVQKNGEMPDQVYKVSWNGADKVKYTYDNLGRLTTKHIGSFDTDFTYEDVTIADDQRTTTLVKSVTTPTGTLTYEYDKLGNILSVTDGNYTTSYEYDSLNQLVRVNDEKAGKTYTYSYTNGNITSQSEYPYTVGVDALIDPNNTKTWEYNDSTWSDLLTNYNGTPITYDEIGNPLTIGEKSLTWTGRQLQSITDGDSEIAYTYNGDGLRTSKTVNGETTNYYYNGSILAGQKSGDDTLVFMYDNNSDIFGFIYNNTEYYYIKNAQNDVIAIADKDGKVALKYSYDAWGKVISITDRNGNDINNLKINKFDPNTGEIITEYDENGNVIVPVHPYVRLAHINPILYRSYYYDKETEWYYLTSRFYNPEFCRFINSDNYALPTATPTELTDKNLFAYCDNNPITRFDKDGQIWAVAVGIGAAVGAVVGIAGQILSDMVTSALKRELYISNWQTYVGAVVGGAAGGAVLGGTGNMQLANVTTGFVTTGVGMTLDKLTGVSDASWGEIAFNAAYDGAVSWFLGEVIQIKNVTSGRNSDSAVFRSGLTKLRRRTARRMSWRVVRRGGKSFLFGGFGMDFYYGRKQYTQSRLTTTTLFLKRIGRL